LDKNLIFATLEAAKALEELGESTLHDLMVKKRRNGDKT
jgi:hypothetical protein